MNHRRRSPRSLETTLALAVLSAAPGLAAAADLPFCSFPSGELVVIARMKGQSDKDFYDLGNQAFFEASQAIYGSREDRRRIGAMIDAGKDASKEPGFEKFRQERELDRLRAEINAAYEKAGVGDSRRNEICRTSTVDLPNGSQTCDWYSKLTGAERGKRRQIDDSYAARLHFINPSRYLMPEDRSKSLAKVTEAELFGAESLMDLNQKIIGWHGPQEARASRCRMSIKVISPGSGVETREEMAVDASAGYSLDELLRRHDRALVADERRQANPLASGIECPAQDLSKSAYQAEKSRLRFAAPGQAAADPGSSPKPRGFFAKLWSPFKTLFGKLHGHHDQGKAGREGASGNPSGDSSGRRYELLSRDGGDDGQAAVGVIESGPAYFVCSASPDAVHKLFGSTGESKGAAPTGNLAKRLAGEGSGTEGSAQAVDPHAAGQAGAFGALGSDARSENDEG